MRHLIITIAALIVLALPASASASDAELGRLGRQATSATQSYLACTAFVPCIRKATAVTRADTAVLGYLTSRIKSGHVKYGSACWRANTAIGAIPKRNYPWNLATRWALRDGVTKAQVVDAQIAFLHKIVAAYQAC